MTGATIEFYKEYYALPEIKYEESVSFEFFKRVKERHDFIVLVIFNENKEILLIRDLNKNIGWELPGGYVKSTETIEDAVNRITLQETGLEVDEVYPISFVKNIFKFEDHEVTHTGVAFVAMSRGAIHNNLENVQHVYTSDVPEKMAYQNIQVLKFAKQKVNGGHFFMPPYDEIESAKKHYVFYFIHEHLIKKISSFASRRILNQLLKLTLGHPNSILDASCGDCKLIFQLHKVFKPAISVANDVSWKTISLIKSYSKSIIFTNHNILNFPFKNKFDLIIFRNTLHHIQDDQQIPLLRLLTSKSKQLVIIDIDDPIHGNFLARLWNRYYRFVLGDQGDDFLTFAKFKNILKSVVKDKKCRLGKIHTMKGQYFYASISD